MSGSFDSLSLVDLISILDNIEGGGWIICVSSYTVVMKNYMVVEWEPNMAVVINQTDI